MLNCEPLCEPIKNLGLADTTTPREDDYTSCVLHYVGVEFAYDRFDRARAELRADRRPAEAYALLARAMRQVESGKPAEARVTLLAAGQTDPASPRAHYNMGVLALEGGDLGTAAESLSRAAGLGYRPAADVAVGLGNVAYRRGDHGRARALFERALEPGSVVAARNLGAALAELGDYDGAVARFRQSLAADQRRADAPGAGNGARAAWRIGRGGGEPAPCRRPCGRARPAGGRSAGGAAGAGRG